MIEDYGEREVAIEEKGKMKVRRIHNSPKTVNCAPSTKYRIPLKKRFK
jgi:hypothetical protein